MYASLLLPWTEPPSPAEDAYRAAGLVKTKGSIFLLPPPSSVLRDTYNVGPRPRSRMSSGAVALCKHFERGGYSSDPGTGREPHPFWKRPEGSNERKSATAEEILDEILRATVWRNVIWLHEGVAVYEVRNALGYGMRWTLDLKCHRLAGDGETGEGEHAEKEWRISRTIFRGFLEPIEGLGHELDGAQASK